MRRTYAWTVSIVMCLVVLSPAYELTKERGRKDGFPLSFYPMFSKPRPALERAIYVVAKGPDNEYHRVRYTYWATGGWNQGRAQMHRYKNGKAGGFPALCDLVAGKLAKREKGWEARADQVHVVRGWYDRETYFRLRDESPAREKTLHRCPVVRP